MYVSLLDCILQIRWNNYMSIPIIIKIINRIMEADLVVMLTQIQSWVEFERISGVPLQ